MALDLDVDLRPGHPGSRLEASREDDLHDKQAAKLVALRSAIDPAIAELDVGLGVEATPEKLMAEVFGELAFEP